MPPFWIGTQIMGGLWAVVMIAVGVSPLNVAIASVTGPLIGWFMWRGHAGRRPLQRRAARG